MNWREFIRQDNPVAAALLSKMGYSQEERVQIKIEFLKMIVRLQVNPAEQRLLYGFFESYLTLSDEEEEKFMREARELEGAEEILEIPISYEERGKEIGREEGREEGRILGKTDGKIEVALGLLREGVAKEIIMKTAHLSLEELKELERRL